MEIKVLSDQREEVRFEDIYLSYFSKMKHFAKEYVILDEDAENIVQDVFVELWENKKMLNMHMNLHCLFIHYHKKQMPESSSSQISRTRNSQ